MIPSGPDPWIARVGSSHEPPEREAVPGAISDGASHRVRVELVARRDAGPEPGNITTETGTGRPLPSR